MKKCVLFVMILFSVLMSCSKNSVLYGGNYVMELNQQQKEDEKIAPVITINTDKKEFMFSYDVLSSYLNIGTYEVKDNVLTATTQDEKYHYVFHIVDENTLSFIEQESSEITIFDNHFGVVPQDGAIFQKE